MRTIHLPIAEPCHEDWDAMDPRERGRFCQRCSKDVYDLSAMTEDEAQAFLRERAGTRVCVNYRHDDGGRIQFRPRTAAALAATAIAATAIAACAPHERPVERTPVASPVSIVEPPQALGGAVVVPEIVPEPPAPTMVRGEIAPPDPPVHATKGDVAVPNEPCDPEPPAVERPQARMGRVAPQAVKGELKRRGI